MSRNFFSYVFIAGHMAFPGNMSVVAATGPKYSRGFYAGTGGVYRASVSMKPQDQRFLLLLIAFKEKVMIL